MKFVNSSVTLLTQDPWMEGMLKHIELAGRVAYKSEDKITEDSCKKFVEMLKGRKHNAPLEHGTVYLTVPSTNRDEPAIVTLRDNIFTEYIEDAGEVYITTNYRVIVENCLEGVLKYMTKPTKFHSERRTFRIVCSRGISHELVRHRVFSFVQESTRYCNYSKDKYDSCITYVIPSWIDDITDGEQFGPEDIDTQALIKTLLSGKRKETSMILVSSLVCAEQAYMEMLKQKLTPQQAREVLPNALKTEVVMTGNLNQWSEFLKLRSPQCGATGMHPDMAVIADIIYDALKDEIHIPIKK